MTNDDLRRLLQTPNWTEKEEEVMLTHRLTHHTYDEDDQETNVFYDTLVNLIDDLTHHVNANDNVIEIEYDEELMSITIRRC